MAFIANDARRSKSSTKQTLGEAAMGGQLGSVILWGAKCVWDHKSAGGSKAIYPVGIDARDLSLGDAH
jgi:hypothetical protein